MATPQSTKPKVKACDYCVNSMKQVDYKNFQAIIRYTSSYAKIVPRRRSGVCAKHQRKLAMAIKRARFMGLLPYIPK